MNIAKLIILLCLFVVRGNGQIPIDSVSLRRSFLSEIDSLDEFDKDYNRFLLRLDKLSKDFCLLNADDATRLLNIYLQRHVEYSKAYTFLLQNSSCFNDKQLQQIRAELNSTLSPTHPMFYKLTSRFRLGFRSYLVSHLKPNYKESIEKDFFSNHWLSKQSVSQIKIAATLANLGDEVYTDTLLQLIQDTYDGVKDSISDDMWFRFEDIVTTTLQGVDSRSIVINTLYLLDEDHVSSITSNDYGSFHFGAIYFGLIGGKFKFFPLPVGRNDDFIKKRKSIKKIILKDNRIWKDYVKVD